MKSSNHGVDIITKDQFASSSELRRKFLDTMSMSEETNSNASNGNTNTPKVESRNDDNEYGVYDDEEYHDNDDDSRDRDQVHTISYGYSKHQDDEYDDDRIFDLSDEEEEDEKEHDDDHDVTINVDSSNGPEKEEEEELVTGEIKESHYNDSSPTYKQNVVDVIDDEEENDDDDQIFLDDDPSIDSIPQSSISEATNTSGSSEIERNRKTVEALMERLSTPPTKTSTSNPVVVGSRSSSTRSLFQDSSTSLQDSTSTMPHSNVSASMKEDGARTSGRRVPSRESSGSLSISPMDFSEENDGNKNAIEGEEIRGDILDQEEPTTFQEENDNERKDQHEQPKNDDHLIESNSNDHSLGAEGIIIHDDEDKIFDDLDHEEVERNSDRSSPSRISIEHIVDADYDPFGEREMELDDNDDGDDDDEVKKSTSTGNQVKEYYDVQSDHVLDDVKNDNEKVEVDEDIVEETASGAEEVVGKASRTIEAVNDKPTRQEIKPTKAAVSDHTDVLEKKLQMLRANIAAKNEEFERATNAEKKERFTADEISDLIKDADDSDEFEIEDEQLEGQNDRDSGNIDSFDGVDNGSFIFEDKQEESKITDEPGETIRKNQDEQVATNERHLLLNNSKSSDSLEDLLGKNNEKVDLYASFNAQRADSPPPILEANSSLSSSSSKFGTKDVQAVFSAHNDDFEDEQNSFPYTIYNQPTTNTPEPPQYTSNPFYNQMPRSEPKKFVGDRLYSQGIQRMRQQAIEKKNGSNQKRDNLLDLPTRAYNERSYSNLIGRGSSVYNRLYGQSKTRETPQIQGRSDSSIRSRSQSRQRSFSTERSYSAMRSRSQSRTRSSNDEVVRRLYTPNYKNVKDEDSTKAVQSTTRRYPSRSKARNNNNNNDGMTANERLYNLAKKKRVLEMEREKRRKAAEEDKKKKSRAQSRRRSSTHQRSTQVQNQGGEPDIFDRLYYLAKAKKDEKERAMMIERNEEEERAAEYEAAIQKKTEREADEGFSRLYSKSFQKQLEGKQRRESIARSTAPRAPTPSRKISVQEANGIYNRGMVQKMNLEIKREEEGINKNYVSPLLNPLVEDPQRSLTPTRLRDSSPGNSSIRNRTPAPGLAHPRTSSRIRPRSRMRAMSPHDKAQTPFRSSTNEPVSSSIARTRTPSRRNATPQRLYDSPLSKRSSTPVRPTTPGSIRSGTRRSNTPTRRVGTPNTRTRSPTPSRFRESTPIRRQKQDSTRQMLRKLETEVKSQSYRNVATDGGVKKETDTIYTASTKSTKSTKGSNSLNEIPSERKAPRMESLPMQYLTHAQSQDYAF